VVLDGECGEGRVGHKIAGGSGCTQHPAEFAEMQRCGARHADNGQSEPFLDVCKRFIERERLGHHAGVRAQTDEGAQHDLRECHGFLPGKCLLQPDTRCFMPHRVAERGVDQEIRINEDHTADQGGSEIVGQLRELVGIDPWLDSAGMRADEVARGLRVGGTGEPGCKEAQQFLLLRSGQMFGSGFDLDERAHG
jgi:hypothetical protein